MPSLCQDLKISYEHLQKLTADFTAKYLDAKESGDLQGMKKLQKDLQATRDAFFEYLPVFMVPNAKNPHHEALLEAGLDLGQTQDQQEMRVDIRKEIQRQLEVYREVRDDSGKPCLEEWVKDITENQGLIYAEIAKDPAKIRERIKAGMIPVVMPGRLVQERTWEVAMASLKPIWIKNGGKATVDDAFIYEAEYKADTNQSMTQAGFFKDIPDRPYLVWTKPTQGLEPATLNKSFDDQRAYYATLVAERPDLYDAIDLIPTEYGALQAIFTSHVQARFKELHGGASEPTDIKPLDAGTCTSFLSAGRFSDDDVPCAYFFSGLKRVSFSSGSSAADGGEGFRPASRS